MENPILNLAFDTIKGGTSELLKVGKSYAVESVHAYVQSIDLKKHLTIENACKAAFIILMVAGALICPQTRLLLSGLLSVISRFSFILTNLLVIGLSLFSIGIKGSTVLGGTLLAGAKELFASPMKTPASQASASDGIASSLSSAQAGQASNMDVQIQREETEQLTPLQSKEAGLSTPTNVENSVGQLASINSAPISGQSATNQEKVDQLVTQETRSFEELSEEEKYDRLYEETFGESAQADPKGSSPEQAPPALEPQIQTVSINPPVDEWDALFGEMADELEAQQQTLSPSKGPSNGEQWALDFDKLPSNLEPHAWVDQFSMQKTNLPSMSFNKVNEWATEYLQMAAPTMNVSTASQWTTEFLSKVPSQGEDLVQEFLASDTVKRGSWMPYIIGAGVMGAGLYNLYKTVRSTEEESNDTEGSSYINLTADQKELLNDIYEDTAVEFGSFYSE